MTPLNRKSMGSACGKFKRGSRVDNRNYARIHEDLVAMIYHCANGNVGAICARGWKA